MDQYKTIGKAIKTKYGYRFIKQFENQGHIYKYIDDLNKIDNNFPIYQAEYQQGSKNYETKATLKKLCKGSKVKWQFLLALLDWQHAETLVYELIDNK
jgi:hypothetical protein